MHKQSYLLILGLFLLNSCGGGDMDGHRLEDPELPIANIPSVLHVQGKWKAKPEIDVRDLGTTKLVTLKGRAQISLSPNVPRLAGALNLEQRESHTWVNPTPGDCELTQNSFVRERGSTLGLEVTLWGWDRAGVGSCEKALEEVQAQGLSIVLKKVAVRASASVPQVEITLSH